MTQRLTFGHIVNHMEPKGSKYVLKAVDELHDAGYDFGFVYMKKVPHKVAMQTYEYIDIILEQFILGWYGLQAIELMAKGKIVVAWINYATAEKCINPELLVDLPIFSCEKEDIKNTILKLMHLSNGALEHIGKLGKDFVTKWHSVDKIGNQIIDQYKKEVEK